MLIVVTRLFVREEAGSMLATSAEFWPLFWGLIGGGAALTVVLTLFVATVPVRRVRRLRATAAAGRAPGKGEGGRHLPAAA